MDIVKLCNKEKDDVTSGIYYVRTKQYFSMRGNEWFLLPIIVYCLQNGLLKLDNNKYFIKFLITIPSDYYNKFIE